MTSDTQTKKKKPLWLKILIGIVVVCILASVFSGSSDEEDSTASSNNSSGEQTQNESSGSSDDSGSSGDAAEDAVEEEAESITTYSRGSYKVGSDLEAGIYYLEGSGYFAISSDSSGTIDSIIANDNYEGNSIVELEDGQYFEFTGSSMYAIEDYEADQQTSVGEGMYRVGVDIPAGEYKIESTGGLAYIEVSSDASHDFTSIITNDIVETSTYQTVTDGQYLKISDATATLV